jgi:hypothetical protein
MIQRDLPVGSPYRSASTGMSKRSLEGSSKKSFEELGSFPGSFKRDSNSANVSIAADVGEGD